MTCCSASQGTGLNQAGPTAAVGQAAADLYARLLAAEPHVTEQKQELRVEAGRARIG
jgi:hypothetical protein